MDKIEEAEEVERNRNTLLSRYAKVKLIRKHDKKCAVQNQKGFTDTPWCYLKKIKYKGVFWWTAKCDDPRCKAKAMIKEK
jgi:hypothetical protein